MRVVLIDVAIMLYSFTRDQVPVGLRIYLKW